MKAKNDIPSTTKAAIEKEEAFRLGYTAGTSGAVKDADDCPLRDPILRRRWREGYNLGANKGLKIALPKMAR